MPAGCVAAQVVSCTVAQTSGGSLACCFSPKIYIAMVGQMASGVQQTFQLSPKLDCQQGYRAAGGTD
eukprot:2864723-Prymnesium_polylepis.1